MHRALTLALVGTTLLLPSPSASAAASRPPSTIQWHACPAAPAVDCGTVRVPIDWNHPDGDTVGIAVARLKASAEHQRKGVLAINPGGPAVSGVAFAIEAANKTAFTDTVRANFDIVGFDPRGVGASQEIRCDAEVVNAPVPALPANRAEYGQVLRHNRAAGLDCRQRNGKLSEHVDTTSVVRDLDAIRAALGERKISYYGVSYGTQIGQQYAELFPDQLRAMVIDSNLDHSIQAARYLTTANLAFESSFTQFAAWCRRTDGCALAGQDVLAIWDGLYAKAKAGALVDPATGAAISADSLRQDAFGAMYSPNDSWFDLAEKLAALDKGAAPPTRPPLTGPEAETLVENAYQSIWCSDWKWNINSFSDLARVLRDAEAVAPHTHFSAFTTDITGCLGWPLPVSNPQHRLKVRGAPPILVTNSRHDVATPYEWGAAVAQQLPGSVFLTYDGVGHGNYDNSSCTRQFIDRYLTTLRTPPSGTHCPAEFPTVRKPQVATVTPDPARLVHRRA